MKAIIIEDKDARALLDKLELQRMRGDNHCRDNGKQTIESMHRAFHYVVVKWLQEQGADVVGR